METTASRARLQAEYVPTLYVYVCIPQARLLRGAAINFNHCTCASPMVTVLQSCRYEKTAVWNISAGYVCIYPTTRGATRCGVSASSSPKIQATVLHSGAWRKVLYHVTQVCGCGHPDGPPETSHSLARNRP